MPSAKDLVTVRGVALAVAGALILIGYIIARLRAA